MDETFGIESPGRHHDGPHRAPVHYLVIIEGAGSAIARLFLASREQVGEVDAGSEEIALLTRGRTPQAGASGAEWDRALLGHSAAERAVAEVYTLAP
jgi:hypothetical protein